MNSQRSVTPLPRDQNAPRYCPGAPRISRRMSLENRHPLEPHFQDPPIIRRLVFPQENVITPRGDGPD